MFHWLTIRSIYTPFTVLICRWRKSKPQARTNTSRPKRRYRSQQIIIINSFYSMWSIGHPWRSSKHCDFQLSPWPRSMIFLWFLFHKSADRPPIIPYNSDSCSNDGLLGIYLIRLYEFFPSYVYILNSVALVRTRTIPTERLPPVGEVSANFCG